MRYRNRIVFYISIILITVGLFMLPSLTPLKMWAHGGILYLGGSISYFIFNFLLLGKLIPLRESTPNENKWLIGVTTVIGLAAIAYGIATGNLFIGGAGFALIYMSLEFAITRNEPIPKALGL